MNNKQSCLFSYAILMIGIFFIIIGASSPVISQSCAPLQIESGNGFTCALSPAGTIQCWGYNGHGELGNGSTAASSIPVNVTGINNAQKITTGEYHACALLSDGKVKCWGYNAHGELGNGNTTNGYTPIPVSVNPVKKAVDISAGDYHTCVVLDDGTAECWGYNNHGQVGNNSTTTPIKTPKNVDNVTDAVSIMAGGYHSCVLLQSGDVKCWGYNVYGQLGNGLTVDSIVPASVTGLGTFPIVQLTAGYGHTCSLNNQGQAKCWGYNVHGELGKGITGNSSLPVDVVSLSGPFVPEKIVAGKYHTCAVLSNGTLKCWGDNSKGQLGDGTLYSRVEPVDVIGVSQVDGVSLGKDHTCAALDTSGVMCWGSNTNGELGAGTTLAYELTEKQHVAETALTNCVACGTEYENLEDCDDGNAGTVDVCQNPDTQAAACVSTQVVMECAADSDCLGGANGKCVSNPTTGKSVCMYHDDCEPLEVDSEIYTSCALSADGSVQCWGYNGQGQVGDGTVTARTEPVDVLGVEDAVEVSVGYYHVCALIADGRIKCWGYNAQGQLGDGTASNRSTPVEVKGITDAVSVKASGHHTCAVLESGRVKCWGYNLYGQIGDNTTTNRRPEDWLFWMRTRMDMTIFWWLMGVVKYSCLRAWVDCLSRRHL